MVECDAERKALARDRSTVIVAKEETLRSIEGREAGLAGKEARVEAEYLEVARDRELLAQAKVRLEAEEARLATASAMMEEERASFERETAALIAMGKEVQHQSMQVAALHKAALAEKEDGNRVLASVAARKAEAEAHEDRLRGMEALVVKQQRALEEERLAVARARAALSDERAALAEAVRKAKMVGVGVSATGGSGQADGSGADPQGAPIDATFELLRKDLHRWRGERKKVHDNMLACWGGRRCWNMCGTLGPRLFRSFWWPWSPR